jgi:hypothetical protein
MQKNTNGQICTDFRLQTFDSRNRYFKDRKLLRGEVENQGSSKNCANMKFDY